MSGKKHHTQRTENHGSAQGKVNKACSAAKIKGGRARGDFGKYFHELYPRDEREYMSYERILEIAKNWWWYHQSSY